MIGRSLGAGATLALTLALAVPAESQVVAGGGVDYLGYSFDEGLGADAAQLFMVPIAVRIPVENGHFKPGTFKKEGAAQADDAGADDHALGVAGNGVTHGNPPVVSGYVSEGRPWGCDLTGPDIS